FNELEQACKSENEANIEEELGDLLFAVVNVSRFLKVQPELALTATTNKFIRRFEYVEQSAAGQGKQLTDMSLSEMDAFWDESKKLEKGEEEN
ncbi:MAG: nucleoside triphosphate pyrophosphohydrolase, partial [Clostridiaceae bacterium]|nr:nucleoside triphosphate pyrophosphohydrolase [Clostridiaceae bacterium]